MAQSLESGPIFAEKSPGTGADWLDSVWKFLLHPLAWGPPTAFLIVLLAAALFLPQMPGQLNQEPVTAARWQSAVIAQGGLGLWSTLGLYNVLYHPVLKIALALLILVLGVRVARSAGAWIAMRRWQKQVLAQSTRAGTPLLLHMGVPQQRRSRQIDAPPATVLEWLMPALHKLDQRLYAFNVVRIAATSPPAETGAADAAEASPDKVKTSGAEPSGEKPTGNTAAQEEIRIVVTRAANTHLRRGIAYSGLLLAAIAAWTAVVFGWNVTTPVLTPGDSFQSLEYGIEVNYPLPLETAPPLLTLHATTLGETILHGAGHREFRLAQIFYSYAAAPGLILSVRDDATPLRRLVQTDNSASVGLVLETPNGEETILLPEIAAGLRIVRRADAAAAWLIEYYGAGDGEPRARWDIDPTQPTELELPDQPADSPVVITVRPASGNTVAYFQLPGYLLVLIGLTVAVAGFSLGRQTPFFALQQISPWHGATALIVQTTSLAEFRRLGLVAALPAGVPAATSADSPSDDAPEQPAPGDVP